MERGYRDLGRAHLAGADYDDYRSYDRLMRGAGGYLDRDPPLRESYLGSPLGSSYLAGRSGYSGGGGYDRESEFMENLMQQRALQQQLSLRESQLALANSLLLQQEQQQQFSNKSWMDGPRGGGEFREDFKHRRVIYNRSGSQPKNRSTGQDSNAGGKAKGTRGGSGSQRNQNAPNGHRQGSADLPVVTESERTQEAFKKSQKPRRGGRKESGRKETDVGGDSRYSSGSASSSRDSVKPRTESRNSTTGSGSKTVDCGASVSNKTLQDAGRSKGSKETSNPERPTVDDDIEREKSKGKLRCSLCNVEFKDKEELGKHKSSSQHKEKVASVKGDDSPKNKESKGYCYICDVPLNVTFKYHQRTTRHKLQVEKKKMSQKRKMQVTRGCGWCNVTSFKNFTEVLVHRATKEHIENQALYGKKDRDEMSDSKSKSDPRGSGRKEQEHIEVELPPELTEFDPTVVVGETSMIEVTGWFCKSCKRFCNSEDTSKETHCLTELHFNNYKKFMYAKLKREARQKAAEEEQEKKEAEAEAAAENKEGGDGDNANTTTAPSTEQPEVNSQELTMGAEGGEPEGVEVGEHGAETEASASWAEGGEEEGWVEEDQDDEGEAAAEDSAEHSQEAVEDLTGSVDSEKH